MKRPASILIVLVVVAASGCSVEARYDALRQSGLEHARCADMINQQQRAECEASFSLSYEEYKQALQRRNES